MIKHCELRKIWCVSADSKDTRTQSFLTFIIKKLHSNLIKTTSKGWFSFFTRRKKCITNHEFQYHFGLKINILIMIASVLFFTLNYVENSFYLRPFMWEMDINTIHQVNNEINCQLFFFFFWFSKFYFHDLQ